MFAAFIHRLAQGAMPLRSCKYFGGGEADSAAVAFAWMPAADDAWRAPVGPAQLMVNAPSILLDNGFAATGLVFETADDK